MRQLPQDKKANSYMRQRDAAGKSQVKPFVPRTTPRSVGTITLAGLLCNGQKQYSTSA